MASVKVWAYQCYKLYMAVHGRICYVTHGQRSLFGASQLSFRECIGMCNRLSQMRGNRDDESII